MQAKPKRHGITPAQALSFAGSLAGVTITIKPTRPDYGRTEITRSDRDARARVESPRHYADL